MAKAAAAVETQDMFEGKEEVPEEKEEATTTEKAVATADGTAVATAEDYAELFDLKENMEGVDVRLPQIEVIHRGQMFILPGDEKVDKFEGIILDTNNVNAWWQVSFEESGGGSPPQCFSPDGVRPSGLSEVPQAQWCSKCDQNKFGSAGRGKACKNMKRVHVRMPDAFLPYRLTLPPSNLQAIHEYITSMSSKGVPYQGVVTEFSLKKGQNKEGIEYSLINCKMKEKLSLNMLKEIKKQRDELLSIMREQAVGAEEYA